MVLCVMLNSMLLMSLIPRSYLDYDCINLGLIVVKCDDKCRCKNVQVTEASSSTLIENTQRSDDQSSTLPPVSLDTKIDETNLKAHMQLYPDLFDGL